MAIEAINPATGELIARYDPLSAAATARIVRDAHAAFLEWRRVSFEERARSMRNAAAILREEAAALARLGAGDGQACARRRRRSGEVCVGVRVLRRQRCSISRARDRRYRSAHKLRC